MRCWSGSPNAGSLDVHGHVRFSSSIYSTETASVLEKGENNKIQMFKNIDLVMCTPQSAPSTTTCSWQSDSGSGPLRLQIFGSIFSPDGINACSSKWPEKTKRISLTIASTKHPSGGSLCHKETMVKYLKRNKLRNPHFLPNRLCTHSSSSEINLSRLTTPNGNH